MCTELMCCISVQYQKVWYFSNDICIYEISSSQKQKILLFKWTGYILCPVTRYPIKSLPWVINVSVLHFCHDDQQTRSTWIMITIPHFIIMFVSLPFSEFEWQSNVNVSMIHSCHHFNRCTFCMFMPCNHVTLSLKESNQSGIWKDWFLWLFSWEVVGLAYTNLNYIQHTGFKKFNSEVRVNHLKFCSKFDTFELELFEDIKVWKVRVRIFNCQSWNSESWHFLKMSKLKQLELVKMGLTLG